MNTFSAGSAVRFGWETFTKRAWFFIGATFITLMAVWLVNAIQEAQFINSFAQFIFFLVTIVASTLIDMGLTAFFLRAHDDITHTSLKDLWHPRSFWYFLIAALFVGILIIIGLVLLIIPGLIAWTLFAFTKLLVIDRNMGPIEAMKASIRITRENRIKVFLLLVCIFLMNMLGAIALLVGLFVSIPVSMLALTHAYRTLSQKSSHTHPNTTQIPLSPNTSSI